MTISREWLVAVHEAAHAVIGINQGQSITHAFLTRDADGVVVRGGAWSEDWPQVARLGHATAVEIEACSGRGLQIMAGMHAEWEADSQTPPGARGDSDQLSALAKQMFTDERQQSAWILRMNTEIQPLIKESWKAITAVATNLLAGEQSRADIEREMQAHPIATA